MFKLISILISLFIFSASWAVNCNVYTNSTTCISSIDWDSGLANCEEQIGGAPTQTCDDTACRLGGAKPVCTWYTAGCDADATFKYGTCANYPANAKKLKVKFNVTTAHKDIAARGNWKKVETPKGLTTLEQLATDYSSAYIKNKKGGVTRCQLIDHLGAITASVTSQTDKDLCAVVITPVYDGDDGDNSSTANTIKWNVSSLSHKVGSKIVLIFDGNFTRQRIIPLLKLIKLSGTTIWKNSSSGSGHFKVEIPLESLYEI